jgi:hypothetical protein
MLHRLSPHDRYHVSGNDSETMLPSHIDTSSHDRSAPLTATLPSFVSTIHGATRLRLKIRLNGALRTIVFTSTVARKQSVPSFAPTLLQIQGWSLFGPQWLQGGAFGPQDKRAEVKMYASRVV